MTVKATLAAMGGTSRCAKRTQCRRI